MTEKIEGLKRSLPPDYGGWTKAQVKEFITGMIQIYEIEDEEKKSTLLKDFSDYNGIRLKSKNKAEFKEINKDYGGDLYDAFNATPTSSSTTSSGIFIFIIHGNSTWSKLLISSNVVLT